MRSRLSEVGLYGTDVSTDRQRAAFTGGEVPVAVYGLGKMGLPLAAVFAEVSGNVVGVDIDERVVETVAGGACHVDGEPGLADLVAETVAEGALAATSDPVAAAERASVHVVIVPTLLTDEGEPDLATLRAAVESIGRGLTAGDLVVVESTVPPGTCRDVVMPVLCEESGLDRGRFGLAFCPERTSSGRALRDIRGSYPKVVGGVDAESTRAAALVYDQVTENDVLTTSDATTAECVKVFEGLYRDVNIALANELARITDELVVDVTEAIDVANTQPFCDIHTPGPGVGGHCIPVYPYFVTERVDHDMPLVRTARTVNDAAPGFVAERTSEALVERGIELTNASVLLLGATYRAGVAETRHAPARDVARALVDDGISVTVTDPMLEHADVDGWPVTFQAWDEVNPARYDGVVLVTAHEEFRGLDWAGVEPPVLVDARQVVERTGNGTYHYTVGRGVEKR